MRVVNQALGRVIRHRNDYGAILLADERFSRPEMTAGISFWAREFLTIRKDFGNTGTELQRFFAANELRVGKLAGSGGVQQKGAAVGHAMFGQRSGAGGGGGGRRPVFQKPQRVEGGPSKAGSAQSGAQALKGLNEHMHVADAKDVLGPGICDARVGSDQAQVCPCGTHTVCC
jgi:regulator of telomere elongation helicase 1